MQIYSCLIHISFIWRNKDLPSSNREPQSSISGFQHDQICTSNHCTHLISHCACPVNHCRISKQNLTQSYLWLYASPWGNFIKLLCFLWRGTRWLATTQSEGQILFRMRQVLYAFDPKKGSCKCLSRYKPHQSRFHFLPPIRVSSPAPTIIQPTAAFST